MILGVGTDLLEIGRIEEALRMKSFPKRVFTEEECRQSKGRASFLAGCFAVKESVMKCFGTGLSGMDFKEIEVLRDERGKPYVRLYGAAQELFQKAEATGLEVSISDTKELVTAFAVLEKQENRK